MYGRLPHSIGQYSVPCKEMMFYQYLPIKLIGQTEITIEDRLKVFSELIGTSCCDFIGVFGLDKYVQSYVYLTAKCMFQQNNCSFNRPGYHADGFMTDDINYIWSDCLGTIFNTTEFQLSKDDSKSILQMEKQAKAKNEVIYPDGTLLRLDQFNIHKVAPVNTPRMRTFLKLSFSADKYDLIGNSRNHLLNYNWEMRERKKERNIPQQFEELNKQ